MIEHRFKCKNQGKKSKRRREQLIQDGRRNGLVPRHGRGGQNGVFVPRTPKREK